MKLWCYKRHQLFVLLSVVFVVSSCGKCLEYIKPKPPVPPVAINLSLVASTQYPVGHTGTMPVIVTNTSNVSLKNVVYSIGTYNTGVEPIIESDSAKTCANLAVGQACQLNVDVAANAHPGAFQVLVKGNRVQNPVVRMFHSVMNLLTDNPSEELSSDVWISLVQTLATAQNGASGVTPYYPARVIANPNGDTTVLVTLVVGQNANAFNTILLVDGNGNKLNVTSLVGNSGPGFSALTPGSVVILALVIPNGVSQYLFHVETAITDIHDNIVPNSETISGHVNAIQLVTPQTPNAVISVLPNLFSLDNNYESQIVTLVNTGNESASALKAFSSGDNVLVHPSTVNPCSDILAPGASCQYDVTYNHLALTSGTEVISFSYFDGLDTDIPTAIINYAGVSNYGGLTISSAANPNFNFINTTDNPYESDLIVMTNKGLAEITNLKPTGLPPSSLFTFAPTGSNSCLSVDGKLINSLAAGASCTMVMNFIGTSAMINPLNATVSMSYNFVDEHGETLIGGSQVIVTYQTLLSQASIATTMSPLFSTIANNGVDSQTSVVTVINNGDAVATKMTPSIINNPNGIFTVKSGGTCTDSLAVGTSCTYLVQMGPTTTPNVGIQTAKFLLSYSAYGQAAYSSVNNLGINGAQVVSANSAIISESMTASAGWSVGNGLKATPFRTQQYSVSPTVTYTLTNTGAVAANNVKLNYTPDIILPWSVTTDNCTGQNLAANNGSCTVVLSMSTNSLGDNSLDLNTLTLTWSDQDHPSGIMTPQSFATNNPQGGTLQARAYAPPQIVLTMPDTQPVGILAGQNLTIGVQLVAGFNVASQSVSLSQTGDIENWLGINGGVISCTVSSTSPICNLTATAADNVDIPESSITISVNTTGSVPITNNSPIAAQVGVVYAYLGMQASAGGVGQNQIWQFALNPSTGNLHLLDTPSVATGNDTRGLVFVPGLNMLYASQVNGDLPSVVDMYNININTGMLSAATPESQILTGGNTAYSVAVSYDNRYAYTPNYTGSSGIANFVTMYSINQSNGQLSLLSPATISPGALADSLTTIQASPIAPYLYVTSPWSSDIPNAGVVIFHILDNGQLELVTETFTPGDDPAGLLISPNGKFLYTANTSTRTGDDINSVSQYLIEPDGTLYEVAPAVSSGGIYPINLAMTPDNKLLYVVNQVDGMINGYYINQVTGALTQLAGFPVQGEGAIPQTVEVDPTGNYLYIPSLVGGDVDVYTINHVTGMITYKYSVMVGTAGLDIPDIFQFTGIIF